MFMSTINLPFIINPQGKEKDKKKKLYRNSSNYYFYFHFLYFLDLILLIFFLRYVTGYSWRPTLPLTEKGSWHDTITQHTNNCNTATNITISSNCRASTIKLLQVTLSEKLFTPCMLVNTATFKIFNTKHMLPFTSWPHVHYVPLQEKINWFIHTEKI